MLNSLKNTVVDIVESRKNQSENPFSSNFLIGISMLYMMFSMLSGLMVYKIIDFGFFAFSAGVFVNPLTYSLSNVTSETYGYSVSRHMMWWFIISSFIFCFLGSALSVIPTSPAQHSEAFGMVFKFMPVIFAAGTLGNIFGMSLNNYLISKLKVKFNDKKYWLRSIIAIWPGEILFSVIAYPIMHSFSRTFTEIAVLIISTALIKLIMGLILLWPECLIVAYIKNIEKINIFDRGINYRIFQFKLDRDFQKPILHIVK